MSMHRYTCRECGHEWLDAPEDAFFGCPSCFSHNYDSKPLRRWRYAAALLALAGVVIWRAFA